MIDIKDLDKADVLAALYNRAKTQGLGFLAYDPQPMTREEARQLIDDPSKAGYARALYYDYLKGRVMKVDLSGSEFDPWLYDRDNGEGAAQQVVAALRVSAQSTLAKAS